MDISTLKAFFMWCTIINGGLLILSTIIAFLFKDFYVKMYGRFLKISEETCGALFFFFIGFYKIIVITFNLLPYIALEIIG